MGQKKSSRDWDFRIKDILQAIHKIEKYTNQLTLAEFRKNELVVDAVVRNFEIIGEATAGIPASVKKSFPEIPWRQMTEMRNFLIHEYFGVDTTTVWRTLQKDLPSLKQQLKNLETSS